MKNKLWTEQEAAEYLSMAVKTLRNQRASGTGAPYVRLGRTIRYRQADLDKHIENNLVGVETSKEADDNYG